MGVVGSSIAWYGEPQWPNTNRARMNMRTRQARTLDGPVGGWVVSHNRALNIRLRNVTFLLRADGRDLGREGHIRGPGVPGVEDGWEEDGWASKDRPSPPATGSCLGLRVVNSPALATQLRQDVNVRG